MLASPVCNHHHVGGPGIAIITALEPDTVEQLVLAAVSEQGFTLEDRPRALRDRHGLPYGYAIQPAQSQREPDEIQRLATELGIPIVTEAVVWAFVSDLRCRAPLARLAQRIARASQGWVDVDGDISQPYGRAPILGLAEQLNEAGCCHVIDESYYLDASAMETWLRHPMFHVIK